jgi:hypothetical protein
MTEDNTQYELWYSSEGVSITEYDMGTDDQEPVVTDEWWYTWPEVFAELSGVEGYKPHIHSE